MSLTRAVLPRSIGRRRVAQSQWTRGFASVNSTIPISPLNPDVPLDYAGQLQRLQDVRKSSSRPLTLTEKILYSHLYPSQNRTWNLDEINRGSTTLEIKPNRVACHDATATMALLQFISAGIPKVAIPTSVHSDHLIVARNGAEDDLENAKIDHREVYAFLSSASKKYGIGFWKPGAGIIHTTIFENYAFPGGLIIGTDSHTPNAGGMGMLGIGVGGSDAVDAMAGMPWELMCPKIVGVRLTGQMSGWTSSKDIICKLAGIVSVSGGKGKVFEFFGDGRDSLGATAMATVCNMSAEIGSTSCIFPYSERMSAYLSATKRLDIANLAERYSTSLLTADPGSERYYDDIIKVDLDRLEPHINGPFTPDLSHPLSELKNAFASNDWPVQISHAMVGSCTNSSYEDLDKTRQLVRQAKEAGLSKPRAPFMITPGSESIRATAEANGVLQELRDAGATVLSNSCGPCVGQWDRSDVDVKGKEPNSVISSFNRNFVGRHDSNPETCSFVTSPEMVTTFAFAGRLDFNPMTDAIPSPNGLEGFRFQPPVSHELPLSFEDGNDLYQAPVQDSAALSVDVDPGSDRLQLLTAFQPWQPGSATDLPILVKVQGKCTTDHISPAGPWYKYRGHLENISNNMLLAATNAFLPSKDKLGHAIHPLDHSHIDAVPQIAKDLRQRQVRWCIIGDWNYGEGSSREHAALEPRFLNGLAVIACSFARIHETNLKKQGMLPLTFADPTDYDKIALGDRITLLDVEDGELQPETEVTMRVTAADGKMWQAQLKHTFHAGQIPWLRAGSALNHIKQTLL